MHYTHVNRTYSVLKSLLQNQHQRLLEAKNVREQETLPENKHTTQCETIPVPDCVAKFHGVHLEPCYKKFISILAPSRKRNAGNDPEVNRRSKGRRQECSTLPRDLFPQVYFYCQRNRKTVKRTVHKAYKIAMDKVESNVRAAAEKKNDIERLGQFRGAGLIAKELMTHKQSYLEYTRSLEDSEAENSDQNVDDKGDFEGVKAFINQAVLGCNKAVSISVVHEIYGTGFGQQYERSYRAKLKSKLISEYGTKLEFLTIDGKSPEVIASSEGLKTATIIRDKDFILKEAANYLREDILEYAANLKETPWLPSKESLRCAERDLPSTLESFLALF